MSFSEVQIQTATGPNVGTIQKTETGGATVNLERIAVDTDQLNFADVFAAQLVDASQESAPIGCEGKSKIVVKVELSTNSVQAQIRVVLQDFVGLRLYTPVVTPANTGDNTNPTQAGYYHAELYSVDVLGAKQFTVQLIGINGMPGSASVWAAAI